MVTEVAPARAPVGGLMLVTVGAGFSVVPTAKMQPPAPEAMLMLRLMYSVSDRGWKARVVVEPHGESWQ